MNKQTGNKLDRTGNHGISRLNSLCESACARYWQELGEDDDIAEVAMRFETLLKSIGGRYYVCGRVFNPIIEPKEEDIISNWPKKWMKIYRENGYILIDPVPQLARVRRDPYSWSEAFSLTSRDNAVREFMVAAAAFGLVEGHVFPQHGREGYRGGVSISLDHTLTRFEEKCLEPVAQNFHLHFLHSVRQSVALGEDKNLTLRERQCLSYLLIGKTEIEIGEILGIKPTTVRYHVERAKRQLGATTRTYAAFRARNLGLI